MHFYFHIKFCCMKKIIVVHFSANKLIVAPPADVKIQCCFEHSIHVSNAMCNIQIEITRSALDGS